MLSPNTILQSRYLIIRQLGEGGMGTVYEAIDQRVSATVALKEIKAGTDADSRRAFEREAALLANLRHQSLPKVMDYFADDEGEFLVMEFIAGHDLAELLGVRGGPFELHQVLRWADELLKVLEYLHGRTPPVLHRDIKPSNLKTTKQGEIFLLDFGLAKGAAGQMPTLQASRSVRGYTLVYAPLEQIIGQRTDQCSDLYSLGATLYNLLTGIYPTDAPTRDEHVEDGKPDPLQPIDKLNPRVPSEIAAIIHQAMAIKRKQRPANATEMRRTLREAEAEIKRRDEEEEKRRRESEQKQREEAERQRALEDAARRAAEERRQLEEEERERQEAEAQRQQEKAERQPRAGAVVRNQLGMELVYVPAGSFMMGSEQYADEKPVHQVTIREGFYIGRYEVTQKEWQAVMGNNPSHFKGESLPVEGVSWSDVQEFIQRLNARGNGFIYRLPTEAEWEYACHAGTTGDYVGNWDAWYSGNSGGQTHPVGQKQPNGWGLYDMHGNVWEWCADWYHDNYNGAPVDGSAWLSGGEQKYRVLRGGSWYYSGNLRPALRDQFAPDYSYFSIGFRVVALARG